MIGDSPNIRVTLWIWFKNPQEVYVSTSNLELNAGHLRLEICVAMMWHVREKTKKKMLGSLIIPDVALDGLGTFDPSPGSANTTKRPAPKHPVAANPKTTGKYGMLSPTFPFFGDPLEARDHHRYKCFSGNSDDPPAWELELRKNCCRINSVVGGFLCCCCCCCNHTFRCVS